MEVENFLLISALTGLARDHPQSYHYFMFHNFFHHIDIDPVNVHLLDGGLWGCER